MTRYARGTRAWGQCARTGERVLLRDLVRDGRTGLPVTREAWEPKHPQERPVRAFDPVSLRHPAPSQDITEHFVTATFTWDPGSLADGTVETKTVSLSGASVGDTVIVYPGVDLAGVLVAGYVATPGVVAVVALNMTGSPVDLASSTWQVLATPELRIAGRTAYAATFDWPVLVDGQLTTKNVAVTGAVLGDTVLVYPGQNLFGLLVGGHVSAAGTVTVTLGNLTGGDVDLTAAPSWSRWTAMSVPSASGVTELGARTVWGQSSLGVTTFAWDPGSVADGATDSTTVAVTGAALGDAVLVYPGVSLSGLAVCGYVSAVDTVTVALGNLTGGDVDLASATWAVEVLSR